MFHAAARKLAAPPQERANLTKYIWLVSVLRGRIAFVWMLCKDAAQVVVVDAVGVTPNRLQHQLRPLSRINHRRHAKHKRDFSHRFQQLKATTLSPDNSRGDRLDTHSSRRQKTFCPHEMKSRWIQFGERVYPHAPTSFSSRAQGRSVDVFLR